MLAGRAISGLGGGGATSMSSIVSDRAASDAPSHSTARRSSPTWSLSPSVALSWGLTSLTPVSVSSLLADWLPGARLGPCISYRVRDASSTSTRRKVDDRTDLSSPAHSLSATGGGSSGSVSSLLRLLSSSSPSFATSRCARDVSLWSVCLTRRPLRYRRRHLRKRRARWTGCEHAR